MRTPKTLTGLPEWALETALALSLVLLVVSILSLTGVSGAAGAVLVMAALLSFLLLVMQVCRFRIHFVRKEDDH